MSRSAHFVIGSGRADPVVSAGADRYRASMGLGPGARDFSRIQTDPVVARHVAGLYEAAVSNNPAAHPAYRAMAEETSRQFDHMTAPVSRGGMGMTVNVTPHDPYAHFDSPEDFGGYSHVVRDVQNGHLNVFSTRTTGGHPFFTDDQNDQFRAVHDTFGHVGTNRGFDRHGEEAAWRAHSAMYSPLARQAMTSETRGQNSAYTVGSRPGEFPEQKVATLGPTAQLIGRRALNRNLGRQFTPPPR